MVSKLRLQRISDRIQQEISDMLIRDLSDPRLAGVTITDVIVDRELAFADIYVSAVEGSQRSADILSGFSHAQGYIRHELSQRIELRVFPRLRFHWDPTPERADHIEQLIKSLGEESASSTPGSESVPEANDNEG